MYSKGESLFWPCWSWRYRQTETAGQAAEFSAEGCFSFFFFFLPFRHGWRRGKAFLRQLCQWWIDEWILTRSELATCVPDPSAPKRGKISARSSRMRRACCVWEGEQHTSEIAETKEGAMVSLTWALSYKGAEEFRIGKIKFNIVSLWFFFSNFK